MVFLRASSYLDPSPVVRGRGVFLRQPALKDYAEWAALRAASRAFLEPWEPLWPADDLTRGAFRYRIRPHIRDARADVAYAFFTFAERPANCWRPYAVERAARRGAVGFARLLDRRALRPAGLHDRIGTSACFRMRSISSSCTV